MIPKIIHYCWFGHNPLPSSAIKCINSWKTFFPDYEIKEWNEDNFDVNIIPYTQEAYEAKKYAFVSDYARFWILYKYGGLYFDTDVEVIKPMDDIVAQGPFMGFEKPNENIKGSIAMPAPGLGLLAEQGQPIYKEILNYYDGIHYCDENGVMLPGTVVQHVTKVLEKYGLKTNNEIQVIGGITIYPSDVFCPMDSTTGIIDIKPNTVSIHHYTCSWMDQKSLRFRLHLLKNKLISIFGAKWVLKLSNILVR